MQYSSISGKKQPGGTAPRAKAADVLKKSQDLDDIEHRMIPFIEKFRSIKEAVKQFGRI